MKRKTIILAVVAAAAMALTPETFKDFLQIIYHIFDW